MSEFFENNDLSQDNSLNHAWNEWDAGVPSNEVWEAIEEDLILEDTWFKLDEELALERVWSKLDEAMPHAPNSSMAESFNAWNPELNSNGWAKLDEELSRERVWVKLRQSLSNPVAVQMPILKMVASTILFISIAFYTDYGTQQDNSVAKQEVLLTSTLSFNEELENQIVRNKEHLSDVFEFDLASEQFEKQVNTDGQKMNDLKVIDGTLVENTDASENSVQVSDLTSSIQNQEEFEFKLGQKDYYNEQEIFASLYRKPKVIVRPKWSLGIGSQVAVINEDKRNDLTSTLPRFGFAADAQHHMYFKDFRWSNGFGFAQYKQENGRYLNGRYMQSNQNLNTANFSSSIGYNFQRFTFFGGIMVNKLLNGYEGTKNVTTNVYNSKHLQVGGKVGLDYNFKPFKNNTCLGITVQYQFVPSLKSINQSFNDIHGMGLQLKFSF